MYDKILVGLIVAAACLWMVRSLYRNLTGKADACNCGTSCSTGCSQCQISAKMDGKSR